MPRQTITYEVLIASPSDVREERQLVADVIQDWNSAHSKATGVIVQPIRWELDAVPQLGDRPQAIINRELVEGADMVVALFSERLGAPTGVAESGTAEEIERLRLADKNVMVYFSRAPLSREHDPEELKRLDEYKKRLMSEGLYCEFENPNDLRRLVSRHLASVMAGVTNGRPAIKTPDKPEVGLRIFRSRWGRSGDIRTANLQVELSNLTETKTFKEYTVTILIPEACLTHTNVNFMDGVPSDDPKFRKLRATQDRRPVIHAGDRQIVCSVELGVDQLDMKGTFLEGDKEAALNEKVSAVAIVNEQRITAEMTVRDLFAEESAS